MHESFVVRVYRQEKGNPRMLVGTVEKVGEAGKSAFTNVDELWHIVSEHAGWSQDSEDGRWNGRGQEGR